MLQPYASNFERIWHWSHRSLCGLVLLFLMLPVLVMIPLSFNGGAFLVYPLQGWSLRWYETFFTSPEWMRGLEGLPRLNTSSDLSRDDFRHAGFDWSDSC